MLSLTSPRTMKAVEIWTVAKHYKMIPVGQWRSLSGSLHDFPGTEAVYDRDIQINMHVWLHYMNVVQREAILGGPKSVRFSVCTEFRKPQKEYVPNINWGGHILASQLCHGGGGVAPRPQTPAPDPLLFLPTVVGVSNWYNVPDSVTRWKCQPPGTKKSLSWAK